MDLLIPAEFRRRLEFMAGPFRKGLLRPALTEEQPAQLQTARDWLERFEKLAYQLREILLTRVLNPTLPAKNLDLILPSLDPIPGWDNPGDSYPELKGEVLFDPEIASRIIFVVEGLLEETGPDYFRELVLLQIDRLDLLASLLQTERANLN